MKLTWPLLVAALIVPTMGMTPDRFAGEPAANPIFSENKAGVELAQQPSAEIAFLDTGDALRDWTPSAPQVEGQSGVSLFTDTMRSVSNAPGALMVFIAALIGIFGWAFVALISRRP